MEKRQVKGYLLEIALSELLTVNGYDIVRTANNYDIFSRGNGLNLRGRGGFHQFDSLGTLRVTPPFMYPLRNFLEAKFYSDNDKVGIDIVRKGVGILHDINTNYSTVSMSSEELILPKYHYNYTIASTSGFTKDAQLYAIAHKIFLLDLRNQFPLIKEGITRLVDWLADTLGSDNDIPKEVFKTFANSFEEWLAGGDINYNYPEEDDEFRESFDLIKSGMHNKAIYLASTNSTQLIPLIPDSDTDFKNVLRSSPHQRVQITWNPGNENWIITGYDTGIDVSFRLTFKLPDTFAEYIFSKKNHVQERANNTKESALEKLTFIAFLDDQNPTICTLKFDRESTKKLVKELNNKR